MSRSAVRSVARRILSGSTRAAATIACVGAMFALPSAVLAQGLYDSPAPNLSTTAAPAGVATADFAQRGYQGLAVTVSSGTGKNSTNDVEVFLNNGAGFGAGTNYATCKGSTAVLAQDLNGDGYPDLVVACPSSDTVDILFNNGAANPGTFGAANSYTATDPVAIVAGDFTNDGQIDLIAANGGTNGGAITFFKNSNGTFTTSTHAAAGDTLSGITAGDFNHDGNLDIALSDSGSNNIHVELGNGDGTFGAEANVGAGSHTNGIQTADFNSDGNLDLAVTTAGGNASIFLGSSTGTFTLHSTIAAGTDPIGLVVTDVNSDGAPDVIALDARQSGSTTLGATAVLLGNGDGTLQTAQISNLSAVPGSIAAVADFSRDGKPDFAITQSTDKVSLVLNNTLPTAYPDGRSYSPFSTVPSGNGNMADAVAAGDFNNDGKLDIAVTYLEDNEVRVLQNNGGTFTLSGTYPVGQQPYWVASADLNGDGYPDLVTANTNPNSTTGTVSVLLNKKNGTFASAVSYTVGKDPYQVAIGNANNDGIPYLAVANYASNTVTVLKGSTAGTFTTIATLPTCANPYGVAFGDFKHNGYPSIVATCYGAAQADVFSNNGNGTFNNSALILTTNANPGSVVVGDFNRDGNLDIVVANTTANDVSFFAGSGNNSFAAGVTSPSLNFPATIAAGDINGDGILDIVGTAPNYNAVIVTLGVGDGTFGTIQQRAAGQFSATKQPWGLALGDFNNDGKLDIVTANTYNQVNIAQPAYQQRYIAEYPAIPGGNPSIDLLTNYSATNITVASSPVSPIPAINNGTTVTATVSPAIGGSTATGSVIFEDATGAPVGSGPYDLSSGVATYSVGHLGSGSYLFTTLYSGDANYQPYTVSGSNAAITVAGTPVTLVLSADSVDLGSTFTATVTVIGNGGTTYPNGTASIYAVASGSTTPVLVETTGNLNHVGNNGTITVTITANAAHNLPVGTYELYAVYNPGNKSPYAQGSSSNEPLAVITVIPTSTSISCSTGLFGGTCTSTTTITATGKPVPTGLTVNFSGGGGTGTETTNAAGQATFQYTAIIGTVTITATFPAQDGYGASSNSTSVFCFLICGLDRRGPTIALTPFTGLEPLSGNSSSGGRNDPFSLRSF